MILNDDNDENDDDDDDDDDIFYSHSLARFLVCDTK